MKAKFVYESLEDVLRPKSEEEIEQAFSKLTPNEMLFKASKLNLVKYLKRALELGADVHANGEEALRWALKKGHVEVVKFLLGIGAKLHHDYFPKPILKPHYHSRAAHALRWALGYEDFPDNPSEKIEVVKVLLEAGADVHADDDWALRWASRNGHTEVVKVLLEAGADVHVKNNWPLQMASRFGHVEVVKLLLGAGADVHAALLSLADHEAAGETDGWGAEEPRTKQNIGLSHEQKIEFALQYALKYSRVEVANLLKKYM